MLVYKAQNHLNTEFNHAQMLFYAPQVFAIGVVLGALN